MHLTPQQADDILALQLLVAWAGEGACEPPRLGWWATAAIDETGGGVLLKRLAPRTAAWSGLALAREAARRTEAAARSRLADADRAFALFHLGFEVDEQVADRLAEHRRAGVPPWDVLPALAAVNGAFQPAELAVALGRTGKADMVVEPVGRRLKGGPPEDPAQAAANLAAAIVPGRGESWSTTWPMPFYRV